MLVTVEHEGTLVTYARRETFPVDPAGRVVHFRTQVNLDTPAQDVFGPV